jgi:hypothetical protein
MANVLNVYYYKGEYPPRATIADHLYSFQKYAGQHNCFYLNVAVRRVPSYLKNVHFDLIVFHTIFLSTRWHRTYFRQLLRRLSRLKQLKAVKVALPQDEFLNTDLLCDFINEFNVDCVFSVAPESEWETIYATVDRAKVKFVSVLTGYLDDTTLENINRLAEAGEARSIDVGYRAWRGAEWLGRHGFLKAQISDLFQEQAPAKGLVTDVSTRPEDTFFGAAWYEFLLRCKYLIGVEGGASILDRDGSIREKTEAYVRAHPAATFDEIEANCFPNMDGSLKLFAISPRHLEACATRTCQVLVEGRYNGILEAGRHYIELKRDFSNLSQVLDVMAQDRLRAEITETAYREIVESGLYSYRSFVELVITRALDRGASSRLSSEQSEERPVAFHWMRVVDKLSWIAVMFHWYVAVPSRRRMRQLLVKIFPEQYVFSLLRRLRRG